MHLNSFTLKYNILTLLVVCQVKYGCYFCRLQDLAGYGVAIATGKIFASAFQGRTFSSGLVDLLRKNGRDGNIIILHNFLYLNFWLLLYLSCGNLMVFQVKVMEKDITYMKREVNQNLIHQSCKL